MIILVARLKWSEFPLFELMLSIEVAKCLLGGMSTSIFWEGGNLFMLSLKIDGNIQSLKKLGKHCLKADLYVRGCSGRERNIKIRKTCVLQ